MNKKFIKSMIVAIASVGIISSCSMIKGKDSHKCCAKNKSVEDANKCASPKKSEVASPAVKASEKPTAEVKSEAKKETKKSKKSKKSSKVAN